MTPVCVFPPPRPVSAGLALPHVASATPSSPHVLDGSAAVDEEADGRRQRRADDAQQAVEADAQREVDGGAELHQDVKQQQHPRAPQQPPQLHAADRRDRTTRPRTEGDDRDEEAAAALERRGATPAFMWAARTAQPAPPAAARPLPSGRAGLLRARRDLVETWGELGESPHGAMWVSGARMAR